MATEPEAAERANLVSFYEIDEREKVGRDGLEAFEDDLASRAPRMRKCKQIGKMYALVAEPKNAPFRGCANIKTPGLTGPQLQIQARLMDMILPPTGRIMTVMPYSAAQWGAANASERYANHYIRNRLPYFEQGLDDTLHQMCLYGSAFRRTYYEPRTKLIRSDWIPMEDFVVAWGQRSQCPSLSDVPRYSYVYRMTADEMEEAGADGYLEGVEEALKVQQGDLDRPGSEFRKQAQKIDGVEPPDEQERSPKREIIEQHCRMKLPNNPKRHPALDGKHHYVVLTIDAWSERVLRIAVREEDDPEDGERHRRDMERLDQWSAAQQSTPPMPMDPAQMPMSPEQMPMDMGMMIPPPPPEPPPFGLDEKGGPVMPRPSQRRQICFFTHYRCFPSDGFYGLGYGDILYGIALAMNTILNQHIDGASLTNAKPAFMSSQVRIPRGQQNVSPGSFIEVEGPISQIKDAITFLDPPANDPTTVPLVQMLDGMKDQMVGSADVFSGEIPKSNQTRGGIEKLIEQAITPVSVLGRRVKNALRHELDKIWRCLGVFLPEDQIAVTWNESGAPEETQITRDMFSPMARIVPCGDTRPRTQRMEEHSALFAYVTQNPMLQQVPEAMAGMLRVLTEDGLRMFPDGERLIQFLPPPPGAPQEPPQPKPPWEEEAGWLRGEDSPVHPADDNAQHLESHMAFFETQAGQALDKTGRNLAEQHIRHHYAASIEKGFGNGPEQQGQPGEPPALQPSEPAGPETMESLAALGTPDPGAMAGAPAPDGGPL